jgi:hypothetical protein
MVVDEPAATRQMITIVPSVGIPLKLPCGHDCILNRRGVSPHEIGYDHHVLEVPSWDAEGTGKLANY